MIEIQPENGIPILMFLEEVEKGAREQAEWCARLPHAFHHIALMPDAHQGYAMPVGGVMAMKGAVMPNAVGVDIGCGMIAARSDVETRALRKDLSKITEEILHGIPVGFDRHERPQAGEIVERIQGKGKEKRRLKEELPVVMEHEEEIPYQLGTLGGGNHFIELQNDAEGMLWVMLHSGSRNIGLKIADTYHKIAKAYVSDKNYELPKDYAFLALELPEAQQYLREMQWAMDFALQNRLHMLERVFQILENVRRRSVEKTFEVRTHHNYAAWETHFGEQVLVHRKGAVRATSGEYVTIPGSMGTASYIGCGKGFPDSFQSCSHGAGRRKGRKEAMREISEHDFQRQIGDVIVTTPHLNRIIDEAPSAYKDIDEVMRQQGHLVEIAFRLEPLAVVKG